MEQNLWIFTGGLYGFGLFSLGSRVDAVNTTKELKEIQTTALANISNRNMQSNWEPLMSTFFALTILFILFCLSVILYFYYKKYNKLYYKYKDVVDLEKHKSDIVKESSDLVYERNGQLNEIQLQIDRVKTDYSKKNSY